MSSKIVLQKIFYKSLESVKANQLVQKHLAIEDRIFRVVDQKVALDSFQNLYIFSVGKAAYTMAKEAENILKDRIAGGVAVSLENKKLTHIKTCQSSHPKVSQKSVRCAEQLIKEIKKVKDDDLFVFFLSGGTSAMIEKPIEELSFEEFQTITDALLVSGVDIGALNTVRKSLSTIKGGKLAQLFKGRGYVLVLSDVIGDKLQTIGSAPMYPSDFPHYVIGNNKLALESGKKYAQAFVQKAKVLTTTLQLNSKQAAKYISKEIEKYDKRYDSFCLFLGGESTVKVKGKGIGGRNSELALRLLRSGSIKKNISVLCAGSDGMDGNSYGNGAFVDTEVIKKMKKQKLDPKEYLDKNDSFTFFHKLGASFITGLTGTNVMDFVIILKQNNTKG